MIEGKQHRPILGAVALGATVFCLMSGLLTCIARMIHEALKMTDTFCFWTSMYFAFLTPITVAFVAASAYYAIAKMYE